VGDDDRRPEALAALYVLCLGDVMIVLDSTIVNVALPSIRADLGLSSTPGIRWLRTEAKQQWGAPAAAEAD
jgi:MFS family permease